MKSLISVAHSSRKFCCSVLLVATTLSLALTSAAGKYSYQSPQELTRLQAEIEKQKARLSVAEIEERRDAVMRLGALRRMDASRVVIPALADPAAIVRVAAAVAVLSLPAEECVSVLLPLLNDRDPFVRQEVCYALGNIRNRNAIAALVERLNTDKEDGVRGAAAVALGMIRDEGAVIPLAQILSGTSVSSRASRKRKTKENSFVLRAAAQALGEIRSRAAVPVLVETLSNDSLADDVRREAAESLGRIGDASASAALQAASEGHDAYLSRIALEALHKIDSTPAGKRP